jgi:hypothetical protein
MKQHPHQTNNPKTTISPVDGPSNVETEVKSSSEDCGMAITYWFSTVIDFFKFRENVISSD